MIKKTNDENQKMDNVAAIRKIVVGAIISEYGARELVGQTGFDLKKKVASLVKATTAIQNWFLTHPNTDKNYREVFKKEFLNSNIVLYAELLETVYNLRESDLEIIIDSIKKNIVDEPASAEV